MNAAGPGLKKLEIVKIHSNKNEILADEVIHTSKLEGGIVIKEFVQYPEGFWIQTGLVNKFTACESKQHHPAIYSIGRIFKRLTIQFSVLPIVKTKFCFTFKPLENCAGFHSGIFEIAETSISSIFVFFDGKAI